MFLRLACFSQSSVLLHLCPRSIADFTHSVKIRSCVNGQSSTLKLQTRTAAFLPTAKSGGLLRRFVECIGQVVAECLFHPPSRESLKRMATEHLTSIDHLPKSTMHTRQLLLIPAELLPHVGHSYALQWGIAKTEVARFLC